jgi:3-isopropylmalate/(R)-2-methylmalate dehydratase large subunit
MSGRTLFDKLWQSHLAAELAGDRGVLVIDRVMLHDVTGSHALREMRMAGARPRMAADRLFAVPDHAISTKPDRGRYDSVTANGSETIRGFEEAARHFGIPYAAPDAPEHGIVHVVAPEQGFVAPGQTVVCGDSHTCTLGAFGALAFAVGVSEIRTVLRHQALVVKRPKNLRVWLDGRLAPGVFAKDVALGLIATVGGDAAIGYVVEFAGSLLADLDMEARLTLCNMVAEMGTRYALIAPDDVTLAYVQARGHAAPVSGLASDPDASFDREIRFDVAGLEPQVTWGTSPMQAVAITDRVPQAAAAAGALAYMQLAPGTPLQSVPIDAAFIGSCTNARLSDLRQAARLLRGRRIAPGVQAMCTPGSMAVKLAAEAEGLHEVFLSAGFSWRMPGCSNCAGREGPIWKGLRVVSTTNRNFENRQGPGTRTHLASPTTVAASALAGRLADPRTFL